MSKDIRDFLNNVRGKQALNEGINNYPPVPKILYHGQDATYDHNGNRTEPVIITKFSDDRKRFLHDGNVGFYFTPNKRLAINYAGSGNLYTCEVEIKNPYYFEHMFLYNNKGLIKSAKFIDSDNRNKLFENGFDAVAILDAVDNIYEVVVFDADKIKITAVNQTSQL
jgi:hypothetical protein